MTAQKKEGRNSPIYQVKVTLKGSKPPIWRRIQVASDTRLDRLHRIVQCVMGWDGGHLHQFIVGGVCYSTPMPEFGIDMETDCADARKVSLQKAAPGVKCRILYEYDFGDGWEHDLLVEKVLDPDPAARYPVCLAGKRACPPEDCGGIWGYVELLKALQDPQHPEHKNMTEWIDEDFDPEGFDLEEVNRRLRSLR
jgi:hypothetical protein